MNEVRENRTRLNKKERGRDFIFKLSMSVSYLSLNRPLPSAFMHNNGNHAMPMITQLNTKTAYKEHITLRDCSVTSKT